MANYRLLTPGPTSLPEEARLALARQIRHHRTERRWKGKILRIAHFGMIDELDILSALAAMELVLVQMGRSVKLGSCVAAAGEILARGFRARESA